MNFQKFHSQKTSRHCPDTTAAGLLLPFTFQDNTGCADADGLAMNSTLPVQESDAGSYPVQLRKGPIAAGAERAPQPHVFTGLAVVDTPWGSSPGGKGLAYKVDKSP